MSDRIPLPPLVFAPLLKRIRWGGRKLGNVLGKPIGDESDYAESWEVADQDGNESRVASGRLAGISLPELIATAGESLLGTQVGMNQFPLLIKYLDANDWLSLQVHPNDFLARQYGSRERGKTECWVILQADPGAKICCGLKRGVTTEQLQTGLEVAVSDPSSHLLEDLLHIYPVEAGDCVFVPAGTIHALGPGILLAEIQQQSNLTFRLYDWGKLGSDGQPRPVHIQESLTCTDFARGPVFPVVAQQLCDQEHGFEELVRCEYFVVRRHTSLHPFSLLSDGRFRILMTLAGSGTVDTSTGAEALVLGGTVLLPACCERIRVRPGERLQILEITCP
ncbi:MAG TPA: mannose-6-phosphate isomerase [Planctomycetaceae bacterium]|jgi:mannose-6-phosphate isomerase|nr:mannose-6-phosphate isomerase [Planctomycetaceae bacterium]